MKKIKLYLVMLSCCILMIGCAGSEILERISLVTLLGYDMEEKDKVTATAVIRQINPEFESKVEIQSETEATSKGTRVKIDMKTAKKISAGQLRVVLFGEELAKNGIDQAIHTLMMNNELSTSIYLAVAKDTSKSLIEYPYQDITDVGQHIYNLIDHNVKQQQLLSSILHEIVRDNYSDVRNFALPILEKNGEFIRVDGIAFFKKGKMVGKLPSEDLGYIMMMVDNFKNGTIELVLEGQSIEESKFKDDDQLQIAIDSIKSKRIIKVMNPENNEFEFNFKLDCRLLEIHSLVSVNDPKISGKLEKALSKKIESEISRIIEYSQEINSDIYGFGEQYRSHVRDVKITEDKWSEMYRDMKVKVNVEVRLIRNGVFE